MAVVLDPDKTITTNISTESSSAEKRQIRNARILALLDTFDEGDPQQQREELEELQAGLEAARPGQRRLFDEGINP